jgi:plasmid stabilization system protein ParE
LKYSFHPAAEKELNAAVDYYNDFQSGLGLEFLREIYRTIQNILSFPDAWSPLSENTRRCLTSRFPYGVIYQATDEEIFIIAVMQLNRKPEYWKGREKRA